MQVLVRRIKVRMAVLCFGGWMIWSCAVPLAPAQQPDTTAPSNDASVIRVETRLVQVDTVVTDKKGNYLRDLTVKDFKVWEDNKEQTITKFSFEEDTGVQPNGQKHYLVLFFDNSTMDIGDQAQARQAAAQFIDANAGPNRLIAIVDFGGTTHIAQNFTADATRLKQVVAGVKASAVNPNATQPVELASLGVPDGLSPLGNPEADFGVHTVLLALQNLAKNLRSVSGRKTLVFITAGFPFTPERESELTATIDACNKANVAVYPIDVRGLMAPDMPGPHSEMWQNPPSPGAHLLAATFNYSTSGSGNYALLRPAGFTSSAAPEQHSGGGGGGSGGGGHGGGGGGPVGGAPVGGGSGGHGTTGSGGHGTTGSGGTGSRAGISSPVNSGYYNPYNQPRQIVPQFPQSATTNQQVLYELAEGTGGFVIVNTNDLVGGLEKIAKDQSQYYMLGYKPAESPEGSCHTLKVKVERGGTIVRSRSGYCNVRPLDLLAGNPIEKDLETRAVGEMAGNVTGSMQAPFFYVSPNTARLDLAIDIPSNAVKFEKVKGKQHAAVNVLGMACKADGSVAARFSDTVNLDFDGKKEVEEFEKKSFHYESQFEVASGQYTLKVVFSSGKESFGKLALPLSVDPYDGKQLSLSGVVLSNDLHRVSDLSTDLDAELLEDRKPLMVKGMEVTPSASNHFKKTDNAAVYVEIYEPLLLGANPPKFGLEFKVVDRKNGAQKMDFGVTDTASAIRPGNPVVPLGLKLPVSSLDPGSYRLELRAMDSANNATKIRTADFEVE
jgi:VWFA-related protein